VKVFQKVCVIIIYKDLNIVKLQILFALSICFLINCQYLLLNIDRVLGCECNWD